MNSKAECRQDSPHKRKDEEGTAGMKMPDVPDDHSSGSPLQAVESLVRFSGSFNPSDIPSGEVCVMTSPCAAFIEESSCLGWPFVLQTAKRYSLAPLLYRALRGASAPAESLPENVMKELKEHYRSSLIQSLWKRKTLVPVLKTCHEQGLPVILLKGSFLGGEVYGDPALRPMGDMDILVDQTDISRMVAVLGKSGFAPSPKDEARLAVFLKIIESGETASPLHTLSNHLPQFHAAGGQVIELHYSIMLQARHPECRTADLFSRAVPFSFETVKAMGLSPEDLVLHLCEHYIGHHFLDSGPRGLVDIALTLRRYHKVLDPGILHDRAASWGIQRNVSLCFALCERLTGVCAPFEPRMASWSQAIPEAVLEEALSLLVSGNGRAPFSKTMSALHAASSPWERVRIAFSRLFLPVDTLRLIEPSLSGTGRVSLMAMPKLYCRRLGGLLSRHGTTVFASLLGKSGKGAITDTERSVGRLNDWLGE